MEPLSGHIATVAIVPNSFAFDISPDPFGYGNYWPDAVVGPGNLKSVADDELLERCSAITCDDHLLGARIRSQLTRRLKLDHPDYSAACFGTTIHLLNNSNLQI